MAKIIKRLNGLVVERGYAPIIRHKKSGQIRGRYSPSKLKRRKGAGKRRKKRR